MHHIKTEQGTCFLFKNVIRSSYVYKVKPQSDESLECHKASRHVALGHSRMGSLRDVCYCNQEKGVPMNIKDVFFTDNCMQRHRKQHRQRKDIKITDPRKKGDTRAHLLGQLLHMSSL
ncbi:hypothetical protein AMTR_s00051p00212940 [Amborella trichopoda]|uniref:Uncharacterized protein n=1 Tax=Amborella trichopoda TaxID=13333 RepID=U5D380_AMBTC|nr:hypothetical protein AMTR_s00051p00212940 [Amborella trichopoda]